MGYSCFVDKKTCPRKDDIDAAIGAMLPTYRALKRFIRDSYAPDEDGLRFLYGKKYGWAERFILKGRMLVNLYPNVGFFYVQVNLPEHAVQESLGWELSASTRQAIEGAKAFPEGRWLWIPVREAADLQDAKMLLALRVHTRM